MKLTSILTLTKICISSVKGSIPELGLGDYIFMETVQPSREAAGLEAVQWLMMIIWSG